MQLRQNEDNGYQAVYLVSDEGTALNKAQKEALANTFRQPDTYKCKLLLKRYEGCQKQHLFLKTATL